MAPRLIRWFTYGIGFALIPLIASLLIHFFLGKLTFDVVSRSSEPLFFALMVSASAIADIKEFPAPKEKDITLPIITSALTIGVIVSAILYGAFLFATAENTVTPSFAKRVFWVSIVLATVSFGLATTGQWFLAKIEAQA